MELVIVVLVVGILSAVAFMNSVSPTELSLPSQANRIASDIRQVQMLAYTTGTAQCVNIVGVTDCITSCTTNCAINSLPPIHGGMTLTARDSAPNGIKFNTLGQPTNLTASATYRLATDAGHMDISVALETGFTSTP